MLSPWFGMTGIGPDLQVWWSATHGVRTTPSFVLWPHDALSPPDASRVRRAAVRARRSRSRPGAWDVVRTAAAELAGASPQGLVGHPELLARAAALGPDFARITLRQAIDAHGREPDGALTRVRVGLYSLRSQSGTRAQTRTSRDWVLQALVELCGQRGGPVSRRDVEDSLAAHGLRYSERAVNAGLTALVRDPGSPVTMPNSGLYLAVSDAGDAL